jgi:hypothetical protein
LEMNDTLVSPFFTIKKRAGYSTTGIPRDDDAK